MTVTPEAMREVRRELLLATESEEGMVAAAELRERVGMGHDDLAETLQALAERGEAVMDAPDEWRAPYIDEAPEASVEGAAGDAPAVRVQPPSGTSEAAMAAEDVLRSRSFTELRPPATVRLTLGVASALDAASLGALVKAGIEEAEGQGRPFVFQVG